MQLSPWILGAALFVPVAGAIAGSSISTEPIGLGTDVSTSLPERAPVAMADAAPRLQERLPDHYAMETPEGRVEVHELALRGRYANRYRAAAAALDAEQPRIAPHDRYAPIAPKKPRAAEPLDLAEPQAIPEPARIDVAAELTLRR